MYRLESFKDGGALIVNAAMEYRSIFIADSKEAGERIALGLNQAALFAELERYRFTFETAGLDLGGGTRIKTDRESQGQIANAFVSLVFDLIPDTPFKAVEGFTRITKEQIKPIAKATAAHTRGCFSGEEAVQILISSAASEADIEAIDIAGAFVPAYQAAYAEVMQPVEA